MDLTTRFFDIQAARRVGPRITVIGGGTGLSTMLRGLKEISENLTAVVTVADDGGGSGILRQELGMPPPGDIRNCILALANTEPTMQKLLNYRFPEGALAGQSFGNLFLAALNGISGSFDKAVASMGEVLAVTGRVLPVTNADVYLEAEFENGTRVLGESKIYERKKRERCRIRKVRLIPENPPALEDALAAIRDAEMIVLGPGSLYTSIIPNLLVSGIVDGICRSSALKVYVLNVMTQAGETEGYTAFDHAGALISHGESGLFDICLCNSASVNPELLYRYGLEGAEPIRVDRERFAEAGIELIERPLTSAGQDYARHNPMYLARELMRLFVRYAPRGGTFGNLDRRLLESLCVRPEPAPL